MAEGTDTKQAAIEQLLATFYVPAFIKRCADAGLEITDENQLSQLLDIGAMLNIAETKKTASANEPNLLSVAHGRLADFMTKSGFLNQEPSISASDLPEGVRKALATVSE